MTITVTTIWNINSAPSTVLNTCLIPVTALWDYYNYPHFGRGEWWVLERRNEFPKIPELVHDRGRSQIHIWHHCTGSLQAYQSSDYCFCCIVFFFLKMSLFISLIIFLQIHISSLVKQWHKNTQQINLLAVNLHIFHMLALNSSTVKFRLNVIDQLQCYRWTSEKGDRLDKTTVSYEQQIQRHFF